ncbi:hypothetical protein GGTG_13488 [Gaeumannomyces tritici R3-111a-1]|uniref:Uncharacterized protein n=1 Tax=Gaeumannomyces tritici (strain R3-111a-1) TaxID=644352 RepID=J3PJ06_GAET3|nr:hypothetical protein GGTG_13488 [Gaeumannomyces tritici R3-111a-1]EJT68982.1 hypothetical protein GGTG_13488 [Gaeumannomyces tritici R3-111a-1]
MPSKDEKDDRQRKEFVRKRLQSLFRKVKQLGEGGNVFVLLIADDPLYGPRGEVHLPEGSVLPDTNAFAQRLLDGYKPKVRQRKLRRPRRSARNKEPASCVLEEITVDTTSDNGVTVDASNDDAFGEIDDQCTDETWAEKSEQGGCVEEDGNANSPAREAAASQGVLAETPQLRCAISVHGINEPANSTLTEETKTAEDAVQQAAEAVAQSDTEGVHEAPQDMLLDFDLANGDDGLLLQAEDPGSPDFTMLQNGENGFLQQFQGLSPLELFRNAILSLGRQKEIGN